LLYFIDRYKLKKSKYKQKVYIHKKFFRVYESPVWLSGWGVLIELFAHRFEYLTGADFFDFFFVQKDNGKLSSIVNSSQPKMFLDFALYCFTNLSIGPFIFFEFTNDRTFSFQSSAWEPFTWDIRFAYPEPLLCVRSFSHSLHLCLSLLFS